MFSSFKFEFIMADVNFQGDGKPKSFWKRPEGLVGAIFLIAILAGLGILFVSYLPLLVELAKNVLYLTLMIIAGAGLLYMFFDPRMRNLVWYAYKSMMRSLTGMFVTIDPIGILSKAMWKTWKTIWAKCANKSGCSAAKCARSKP